MKSLLQKNMVLALSALLLSTAIQAGAPQPLNPRAVGQRKDAVEKALAAYNLAQPDLRALPQMMTDAQSIRPGVTNGYTPKEWESLKVQFYTKTGMNLEANPARADFAFNSLLATLQRDRNGNVVDTLATPTVQGAQDFQAAWQAFLALGGNGSLFPNAQKNAAQILGVKIEELRDINKDRSKDLAKETIENQENRIAIKALQQQNDVCENELSECTTKLANLERELTKLQNEAALLRDLQRTTQKQPEQIAQLQQQLAQLQQQIAENQRTIQMRTGERDSLKKDAAVQKKQLDACLAKDSSGLNKATQEQIAQLQQQLAQAQTTNGQVNAANAQLQQEHTELRTALEGTTKHIAELTAQLQALQDENTQLRNARQGK
ncbi:MAG: hypothetical protein LVQ75_03215 [Candidatus Babeliales bacterium]|jgi:predicted  nucleic acid-binding Zn-ribbon protein